MSKLSSTVTSIYSKYLNEERKVWIYIPENDSLSYVSDYPVVYLLDPENYFDSVVEMIQLFGEGEGLGIFTKMVVVGIKNSDRVRDFTPSNDTNTSASSAFPVKDDEFAASGGADKFTLFIKNELVPFIDSSYNTSEYRILIGHSLGGLMAANTLVNYTDLFSAYMLIDPSTWWNHQEVVKQAMNIPDTQDFKQTALFYANSNSAVNYANSIKDPEEKARFLSRPSFGDAFKEHKQTMSGFQWIRYEHETHGTIPLIAIFDGLKNLSDVYKSSFSVSQTTKPDLRRNKNILHLETDIEKKQYSASIKELWDSIGDVSVDSNYSAENSSLRISRDIRHTSANLYKIMGEMFKIQGDTIRANDNLKKSLITSPQKITIKAKVKKVVQLFKNRRNKI